MKIVAVIPARYHSTRLAHKLLLPLGDKSILEHSYRQVCQSKLISEVVIAVDDPKLLELASSFSKRVELTSPEHPSGTDRVAELAKRHPEWQLIVNVQADEPFINPEDIDRAIEPFIHEPLLEMSSLYHSICQPEDILAPSNVKVVLDINNFALYFSRAAIPFERDATSPRRVAKKHIGLYAYRREILLRLAALPISSLESIEKLEQLRALENGIGIKMIEAQSAPIGIDTAEDYQRAIEIHRNNQSKP